MNRSWRFALNQFRYRMAPRESQLINNQDIGMVQSRRHRASCSNRGAAQDRREQSGEHPWRLRGRCVSQRDRLAHALSNGRLSRIGQ
jgi:hypothetical protein